MSIGNMPFFVFFRKKFPLHLAMVHKGSGIIGKQAIAVDSPLIRLCGATFPLRGRQKGRCPCGQRPL